MTTEIPTYISLKKKKTLDTMEAIFLSTKLQPHSFRRLKNGDPQNNLP